MPNGVEENSSIFSEEVERLRRQEQAQTEAARRRMARDPVPACAEIEEINKKQDAMFQEIKRRAAGDRDTFGVIPLLTTNQFK